MEDGGKWSASRPGCFIPRERTADTHWIGGWVDPKLMKLLMQCLYEKHEMNSEKGGYVDQSVGPHVWYQKLLNRVLWYWILEVVEIVLF
jgi:hypothetical protein